MQHVLPVEPARVAGTSAGDVRDRTARVFGGSFALLAGLLLVLFTTCELPMVDLPQHAALLQKWLGFADPLRGDGELVVNLRTPYLLTYALARLISPAVGAVQAFKLLSWCAVVGYAAALTLLARRTGHSVWLGLLGFPAALGHAFYFGFISFMVATPLVVSCLVAALAHAERRSWRRAAAFTALLCLMVSAHGIAFTIALVLTAPLLLRGAGSFIWRYAAYLPALALYGVWIVPGGSTRAVGPSDWTVDWSQIQSLPASLVGMYSDDAVSTIGGLCVLAAVAWHLGKPARQLERLVPLGIVLAGYAAMPQVLFGMAWLNARFTGFLLPCLLLASSAAPWPSRSRPAWVGPALVLAVSVGWLGLFGARLVAFQREAAPFFAFMAKLPPGLAVRPLVFERTGKAFPGVPSFLHFPAYYEVEKGGRQGFTFAIYPVSVINFREPRTVPLMAGGAEWNPASFDAAREVADYDYFIVKSDVDRGAELFRSSPVPVALEAREGPWWGYRRLPAP